MSPIGWLKGTIPRYELPFEDLGIYKSDEEGWRSFHLSTWGDDLEELWTNATIFEAAKHGEEVGAYGYHECSEKMKEVVDTVIIRVLGEKYGVKDAQQKGIPN